MEYAISARGLAKSFRGREAIRGCTLKIPWETIYGFWGENGAGKTTVFKMLLGLLRPTAVEAHILWPGLYPAGPGGPAPDGEPHQNARILRAPVRRGVSVQPCGLSGGGGGPAGGRRKFPRWNGGILLTGCRRRSKP